MQVVKVSSSYQHTSAVIGFISSIAGSMLAVGFFGLCNASNVTEIRGYKLLPGFLGLFGGFDA